ncbi:MAG: hypothetical protein KAS88_00890 [Deltaproteobacteria bacterium]|nr:hypothetical protein [Deltaproteobacteria bacterium]
MVKAANFDQRPSAAEVTVTIEDPNAGRKGDTQTKQMSGDDKLTFVLNAEKQLSALKKVFSFKKGRELKLSYKAKPLGEFDGMFEEFAEQSIDIRASESIPLKVWFNPKPSRDDVNGENSKLENNSFEDAFKKVISDVLEEHGIPKRNKIIKPKPETIE